MLNVEMYTITAFVADRQLVQRRGFHLRTDHKALSWLFAKVPKESVRVSGWIATLFEYPVSFEYVSGFYNAIADILSRLNGHEVNEELPSNLALCPVVRLSNHRY